MNTTRSLVLATALVALVVSACSRFPVPAAHSHTPPLVPQALGTPAADYGVEVAVNRDLGAVFVVGSTQGSLDGPNKGGYDGFLRRYNRDGSLVWRRQFGSSTDDWPTGVATDRAGNVYVATTSLRLNTEYETRATLKKYSKGGTLLWTRPFEMEAGEDTAVSAVATDGAGNVYLAGDTFFQLHIQKYSSSGTVLWTDTVDASGIMISASAITTDGAGNVYVGMGDYDDSWFGSSILKYSGSGTWLWEKHLGDDRGVSDLRVVGGALYAAGYKSYDYESGTIPSDAYAAKFSLDGSVLWDKTFGTSAWDSGTGVTADGSGNTYITGYTAGALAGGSAGGADGFMRKYGTSGTVVWTKQFGSPVDDYPYDLAYYSGGELYLTGKTSGKLGAAHRGGSDAFLRRLNATGTAVWTDQ